LRLVRCGEIENSGEEIIGAAGGTAAAELMARANLWRVR
jgi:hypothetical protein